MDEFAIQLGLDPIELRLQNDTDKYPSAASHTRCANSGNVLSGVRNAF